MNITKPAFDNVELNNLRECLSSNWVTQGPFVKRFETEFAQRHNVRYALATTSCTSALHMAVLALGIGPEDEVVVPAFTWITSAHCVEYTGAKVVFADIDPLTYNLDPNEVATKITDRTKAIVAVHLFGLPAPMGKILKIATEHGLFVIEDAACAVGSAHNNTPVGGIGNVGCFSFHPRKVITTGEGGMITTNSDDLAGKIQTLRNHGATGPRKDIPMDKAYHMATFNALGFNYRMSDIQAAVGVAQMRKLDNLLAERKRLAARYDELLADVEEIITPNVPDKCAHTYQSYVIRIAGANAHERRNSIMDVLSENDIQTRPGTHAVHRLGYYANKYNLRPDDYPNAALCEDTTITLPVFRGMTDADQKLVVNKIKDGLGNL